MPLTAGVMRLSSTRAAAGSDAEPRLEGALRPETPGFAQLGERVVVEQVSAAEVAGASDGPVVEVNATLRNATGRTLSGLEVRGAMLDARGSELGGRTVVVVPARQTAVEPGEAISVRIPVGGVGPSERRAVALIEVTGVRVD